MAKDKTATKTAKPASQKSADTKAVPCRVLKNGMLYEGCHHAKHKQMAIPQEDAEALAKQGSVEILPGLA